MIITADEIWSWYPCSGYTKVRVRELIGDGKTAAEIAELPIPAADRMWVLSQALYTQSPVEARLLACEIASTVAHLGGQVCYDTIAVVRRYARGEATEDELSAARAVASAAAARVGDARSTAARAAAARAADVDDVARATAAAADWAADARADTAYAARAAAWRQYLSMAVACLEALAAGAEGEG